MTQEALNQGSNETPSGASPIPQGMGDTKGTIELAIEAQPSAETKNTEPGQGGQVEKPVEGQPTGAQPPAEGKLAEKKEEAAPPKPAETPPPKEEKPDRLDKHPRFQELIKERNELRESVSRLEGRIDELSKVAMRPAEEPRGVNIAEMSDEKLKEAMAEDPKGFLANYGRQLQREIMEDLEGKFGLGAEAVDGRVKDAIAEKERISVIEAGYNQFAKDNPDFDAMWDSGQIKEYCDSHPHHTPLSAYHELKKGDNEKATQAKIDEAVQKAVKEAEDRVRTDMLAKGGARVIGSGPSAVAPRAGIDPRLKETNKYGGTARVIADMLKEEAEARG